MGTRKKNTGLTAGFRGSLRRCHTLQHSDIVPLLQNLLLRIPYGYELGRKLLRTYRGITGLSALREAVKHQPVRLVIGASGVYDPGWTPAEIEYLDITNESDWQRFFVPSAIKAMLAEHVWEHLTTTDALHSAKLCLKYLRPDGYLRAAVPDGLHPDPSYIRHVLPGGTGPGAHDHKVLYTYQTFSDLFRRAGFRVKLLEYFDETGKFHFQPWARSDGMIHRSSRFDKRNVNGNLTYTSIVLDAFKI